MTGISSRSFVVALTAITHALGSTSPPNPSPSDVKLSDEWVGTEYFPFWELGQSSIDQNNLYGACFPVEGSSDPATDLPCAGLQYSFSNCSYGVSFDEANKAVPEWNVNPFVKGSQFEPLTNAAQQECYCSGDYWEYVRGCNSCMRAHGYSSLAKFDGGHIAAWLAPEQIDEQSSSYCSGEATAQALDFFASYTPSDSNAALTATLASTIPTTITAVSAYATLTHTIVPPTQTSQIGSLAQTAPPAASSSSSSSDASATYEPALVAWATIFLGFVGLLV